VLNSISAFIKRFVVLTEVQVMTIALWILHTHLYDEFYFTPYLHIHSPEKRSGKTRLLEVIELFVASPWFFERISTAALYRTIDKDHPTVLCDEMDAILKSGDEYAEGLRGILNGGFKHTGTVVVCVGQGADITPTKFKTFCPKAFGGIGQLPDTIADRSLSIRLRRKSKDEKVERFRLREVEPESDALKSRIEAWAASIKDFVRGAKPKLPDELTDRQQDICEPILAIADAAGGDWPERARVAVVELWVNGPQAEESTGVQLLEDIREVFESRKVDKIFSAELAIALNEIEASPWAGWSKGKGITANQLARQLKKFDIGPHDVRIGDRNTSGYELEDFEDAFKRYLSPYMASEVRHRRQPNTSAGSGNFSEVRHFSGSDTKNDEIANARAACRSVGDVPHSTGVGEGTVASEKGAQPGISDGPEVDGKPPANPGGMEV